MACTPNGSRVQVPRSFKIEDDLWKRFERVAQANDRSRGAEVRRLIRQSVDEFEAAA